MILVFVVTREQLSVKIPIQFFQVTLFPLKMVPALSILLQPMARTIMSYASIMRLILLTVLTKTATTFQRWRNSFTHSAFAIPMKTAFRFGLATNSLPNVQKKRVLFTKQSISSTNIPLTLVQKSVLCIVLFRLGSLIPKVKSLSCLRKMKISIGSQPI